MAKEVRSHNRGGNAGAGGGVGRQGLSVSSNWMVTVDIVRSSHILDILNGDSTGFAELLDRIVGKKKNQEWFQLKGQDCYHLKRGRCRPVLLLSASSHQHRFFTVLIL